MATYFIEFEREEDGRWLAAIPRLPGVMCYGATKDEAATKVQALALHVLAERMEHDNDSADLVSVSFQAA